MKVANDSDTPPIPSLEDMQHWTWVMGRAQQMMLEHGLQTLDDTPALPTTPGFTDKATMARAQEFWLDPLICGQPFLDPPSAPAAARQPERTKRPRFPGQHWTQRKRRRRQQRL